MRLIDATEVIQNIVAERDKIPYELVSEKPNQHGNSMRGGIRKALRCIEQAPTVDAVPVVRCRECKHYDTADFDGDILCGCTLHSAMVDITPDSFCSYGERKGGMTDG